MVIWIIGIISCGIIFMYFYSITYQHETFIDRQEIEQKIVRRGDDADTEDPSEWTVDGQYYYPDWVYWPWISQVGGSRLV